MFLKIFRKNDPYSFFLTGAQFDYGYFFLGLVLRGLDTLASESAWSKLFLSPLLLWVYPRRKEFALLGATTLVALTLSHQVTWGYGFESQVKHTAWRWIGGIT